MLKEAAVNTHPTDETIAAFVDGRLEGKGREAVIGHLAFCDECRALWDSVAEEVSLEPSMEQAMPANVVPGRFGRRWAVLSGSVAAAAVAAMSYFYLWPALIEPANNLADLKRDAGALQIRPTAGRFTGFPFGETPAPTRGPRHKPVSETQAVAEMQLRSTAAKALDDAQKFSNARNAHLAAVAQVLAHELESDSDTETVLRDDLASAIKSLEEQRRQRPDDLALLNDLSAAYVTQCAHWNKDDDCSRALSVASEAWAKGKMPESGWNRAFAATQLARNHLDNKGAFNQADTARALQAWNEYLAIETNNDWKQEAAAVRDKLLKDDLTP